MEKQNYIVNAVQRARDYEVAEANFPSVA